jgi:protein-glutamine gamma-glutamyltransferase
MIKISDHDQDISELMGSYPAGSVERQILKTMSESTSSYEYDSLEELKFELLMRKKIAESTVELNNGDMSFAVFHKSRCNPEYWDRTDNGGFKLKDGVSASAAIKDIYESGGEYATECATAMQIVYYGALLKVFGEDAFNVLFPDIYLMNWSSVNPNLKYIGSLKKVDDILTGDRAYFSNPDVAPETPEWQGENTIVLPDGYYYGHGIGIKSADNMIVSLNNHRTDGADTSAYLRDSVGRLDYKKLYGIYGNSVHESAPALEAINTFESLYA